MRKNEFIPGDKATSYGMSWAERVVLGGIVSLYVLAFVRLVQLSCTSFGEDREFYIVIAFLWVAIGWLFPWLAWALVQRFLLPSVRENAAVVAKAVEQREYSDEKGVTHQVDYRFITFHLTQSNRVMRCVVPKRYFNLLAAGDHGMIFYKETKKKFFFDDFIRTDPPANQPPQ